MGTLDLSRAADNPAKRYRGARMQMGRVLNEDDFNENERIHDEVERRILVDVIGPTGTPDDGFLITGATLNATNSKIDFTITEGALYLGGHRLEASEDERFQLQSDWLQQADGDRPGLPTTGSRHDLVWIEAIEQEVTAVEDSELFEVGLDTGDTSARTRVMRRVRVLPGIASENCREGWTELLADLATEGTINDELELVPDALLTVGYDTPTDPGDLCSPSGEEGYRGAENQAIRVQLLDPNTFTWGFDNASPLYRATVGTAPSPPGGRRLVHLQTQPADHHHWPLAGQVVELLPWAAVLPNGEKIAERSGFLTTVSTSFDPDSGNLLLTDAVPANFGAAWKTRDDQAALGPEYFYLRVWDRGVDSGTGAAVPFTLGSPESLTHTGITVTLDGTQLPSESHWIAAARPDTPTQVVPWDLEDGRARHGYRRWIAPLAVIRWNAGATTGTVVDDCRQPFLPLTRIRSCCTYTVGDGVISHGQFESIQAAIDALPAEGGEVCILAGRYEQRFEIRDRVNIKVHGCGERTVIVEPDDAGPIVSIVDSRAIRIESLGILAQQVVAVAANNSPGSLTIMRDIELVDLTIVCSHRGAIVGRYLDRFRVLDNQIMLAMVEREFGEQGLGTEPAIFASGHDLLIEGNEIRLFGTEVPRLRMPLGGIQIGGRSTRVEIRRNRIEGGNGNGITLGSAVLVKGADGDPERILDELDEATPAPWLVAVDANGCIHIFPGDPDDPDDENPDDRVSIVSEGPLDDIRIVDNVIRLMGTNGISSLPFIRRLVGSAAISHLCIEVNRIVDNLGLELPTSLALLAQGFGGISLLNVSELLITSNEIVGNGTDFDHPVCGVFVSRGTAITVDHNRIERNGRTPDEPRLGIRGGVLLIGVSGSPELDVLLETTAIIHDNEVLAPAGPALLILGRGGFSIVDNVLSSAGVMSVGETDPERLKGLIAEARSGDFSTSGSSAATALLAIVMAVAIRVLGGAAVFIMNTGTSAEVGNKAVTFGQLSSSLGSISDYEASTTAASGSNPIGYGPVLFDDNQVGLELRDRDGVRSAILLSTLDDLSMQDNQCTVTNTRSVFANALAMGWSTRVVGNRFREIPGRVSLSAVTVGVMNTTAHNQSTHCLRIMGVLKVDQPNLVQIEALTGEPCTQLREQVGDAQLIGEVPANAVLFRPDS